MIDSDMKKITNLLYMLAVLLLASCNDFLDKSPKNTVDPETTVTDDVAIALTNACYRTLQSSFTPSETASSKAPKHRL